MPLTPCLYASPFLKTFLPHANYLKLFLNLFTSRVLQDALNISPKNTIESLLIKCDTFKRLKSIDAISDLYHVLFFIPF